nr:DUF418 domain-containing protein [Nocardiopsis mwathae]
MHFVLIFDLDVLMGYAVTALLVAWLLNRSQGVCDAVMWAAGALHLAVIAASTLDLRMFPGADPARMGAREDGLLPAGGEGTGFSSFADSYWDMVYDRFHHLLQLRWGDEPWQMFPMTVFLFLLGVRMYRAGVFADDAKGRRIRRHLLVWGVGLGLPLAVFTELSTMDDLAMIHRYGVSAILALGYIGLAGLVLDRVRRPGPMTIGLTSLGQVALTGYVAQNLLGSVLIPALGLEALMLDAFGPWGGLGLGVAVCALLMGGSYLWLLRFSHGPAELAQKWALSKIPDRPAQGKGNPENESPAPAPRA